MNNNKTNKKKVFISKYSDNQTGLVKRQFSQAKDYAAEYSHCNTPIGYFFNIRLKRVSELLAEFTNGKVLDVGCGPGKIGNAFLGRPIEYFGIDISKDMINECINSFGHDSKFNFAVGNIEHLPFADTYFDVVLCLGSLEYVNETRIAIQEIDRVLKPNGIIIVTMLNKYSIYRLWRRYVYGKVNSVLDRLKRKKNRHNAVKGNAKTMRPITKLYSERKLRSLLNTAKLKIEDIVYYDFRVLLSPLDDHLPSVSVFLSKRLEFLCKS